MIEGQSWLSLLLFVMLASMLLSLGQESFLLGLIKWPLALVLIFMLTVSALGVSAAMVERRGKTGQGPEGGDESDPCS